MTQMLQAGAFHAIDFVDAGFCSTVMPPKEFRESALPVCIASNAWNIIRVKG